MRQEEQSQLILSFIITWNERAAITAKSNVPPSGAGYMGGGVPRSSGVRPLRGLLPVSLCEAQKKHRYAMLF